MCVSATHTHKHRHTHIHKPTSKHALRGLRRRKCMRLAGSPVWGWRKCWRERERHGESTNQSTDEAPHGRVQGLRRMPLCGVSWFSHAYVLSALITPLWLKVLLDSKWIATNDGINSIKDFHIYRVAVLQSGMALPQAYEKLLFYYLSSKLTKKVGRGIYVSKT